MNERSRSWVMQPRIAGSGSVPPQVVRPLTFEAVDEHGGRERPKAGACTKHYPFLVEPLAMLATVTFYDVGLTSPFRVFMALTLAMILAVIVS